MITNLPTASGVIDAKATVVDDSAQYIRERNAIENRLPAYSRSAIAIRFVLESPAVSLQVESGPYAGSHMERGYPDLRYFSMSYRPSKLLALSPVRWALGNEPFTLGTKDVTAGHCEMLSIPGVSLDLFFQSGPATGGFVSINRDSGKAIFVSDGRSLRDAIRQGFSYELQFPRKSTSGLVGHWIAIDSEIDLADASAKLPGLPRS